MTIAKKSSSIRAALVVAAIFVASGILIGISRDRSIQTVPKMQAFIHQIIPAGTRTSVARQKMVAQGFEPAGISQSETHGEPCMAFARRHGSFLNPVKTQWTVAFIVKDDRVESVLVWKSLAGP